MTLCEIDKTELIFEAYRIEGISAPECRTIFLDWALNLAAEIDQRAAIALLLQEYEVAHPDHPMNAVLREGLQAAAAPKRRGGRAARVVD